MLANSCTLLGQERIQVGEKSTLYYWLRLVREVVEDWKDRGISKPRNTLAAGGYAAVVLRCIRRQACKASGVRDCQAWTAGELNYEPFTNPCISCGTPGLGLLKLSVELWGVDAGGRAGKLVVDEADLRGWMNGRTPISPNRLNVATVNAWRNGWLSTTQAVSSMSACADLEAAGSVARRIFKRLRHTEKIDDVEKIATAVEYEWEQMGLAAVTKFERNCRIPEALKDLPPEVSRVHVLEKMRQICPTNGANSC